MKTEDLRSGHILETENGELGLVVQTGMGLLVQWNNAWGSVNIRRDDIICVRKVSYGHEVIRKYLHEADVVWRKEKQIPEYTMEELQKKLGEEFKIKK